MMLNTKYPRWQSSKIKKALETRRVVQVSGARQCGKTTIVRDLGIKGSIYRTLDDLTLLELAKSDPHNFVKHGDELMIIDEVQRAPHLLMAIKKDVDENQNPGRFLITGSANLQSIPSVQESLAGRIRRIRLRPLALGEIHDIDFNFIKNAFAGIFKANTQIYDKDDYISMAFGGGYPEALRLGSPRELSQWYLDYVESLIERDMKDISKIRRKNEMNELISILAAWSSKYIDMSSIRSNLSIENSTIKTYISALETLYLLDRLQPWIKTDYERVNKKPINFISDTGVMSAILGWKFDKIRLNADHCGKLIETFVYNQLMVELDSSEENYKIFHYRDREKREIDFILQNENNDIVAIEVKSSASIGRDAFKHILWFKENMAKESNVTGIVLYSGKDIIQLQERLWAVPISSLWAF